MKIELKLDKTYEAPKIIITANQVTDEIKLIMDMFSDERAHVIAGFKDGDVVVLDPSDIYRIFARSGKVFAQTSQGDYTLRLRLYEIEQWLINKDFVRISNSEIINLSKVKSFDLSFTGTIYVKLSNGTGTYVSRRYVAKIKQFLGMKGGK